SSIRHQEVRASVYWGASREVLCDPSRGRPSSATTGSKRKVPREKHGRSETRKEAEMSEALTFKEQRGIESMRVVIHQGLLGATADEMRATPQRFRGWESGVLKPEEVLYDYQTVMECRHSLCRAGGLPLARIL